MYRTKLVKIPVLLAAFGISAALVAQDSLDERVPSDCSSLCSGLPDYDCNKDFDFLAAATYEQIRVQGGEIGFITNTRDQALYPVNGYGIYQPEFFSWGFKLGLGYSGWTEGWRSAVKYYYFSAISNLPYSTAYGSAIVPSGYTNNFIPNYSSQLYTSFGNLEAGNKTIINDIKFSLGRANMITDKVKIDTYYCINAAIITRRQIQMFTNDVAFGARIVPPWTNATGNPFAQRFSSNAGGYYSNYQKYSWWGVGPALGIKGNYLVGRGLSVYGDMTGRLQYGNSSVRASTISAPKTRLTVPGTTTILDNTSGLEAISVNSLYQFSPGLETELGISWAYDFNEDQVRATFQIAYENLYYFMVMRTISNNTAMRAENGAGLGVQGLVLQGWLEF